jgi:hypothetical protein
MDKVLRSPYLYLAAGLTLTAWYVYAILDWNRDNLYRKGSLEEMLQIAAVGGALFLLVALISGGAAVVLRGRLLPLGAAFVLGAVLILGVLWAMVFSFTLG